MVSVIIPNWNGKDFLKRCLGSLRTQTYQDFEVIVVDDGSSDMSVELVKKAFPEVRIVPLEENLGFSKAVNQGLKGTKNEFIALLNNDATADPNWLEELVRGIRSSSEIGFCASKILQAPEGTRIDTAGDGYTRHGVASKRGHNLEAIRFDQPEMVFGACAAAALYRKSMLEDIGYFDEDLCCIYEDVDLSFRAQLAGYKCLYVPTAVAYHTVGGTLGTNNDATLYYGQRNMETVFFKNMPLKLLLIYLPLHVAYLVLAFAYNLSRGKWKIYVRSKVDALNQMGWTLRKRKNIQVKKRVSSSYLQKILDRRPFSSNVLRVT